VVRFLYTFRSRDAGHSVEKAFNTLSLINEPNLSSNSISPLSSNLSLIVIIRIESRSYER
jgi:hypothetical protein